MTSTVIKNKSTPAPREGIVNNAPKLHANFQLGDVSHQGDLIIVRIAELPTSAKPRMSRQLADGDTQGSRHVMTRGRVFDADRNEVAKMIHNATKVKVDPQFVGPVFVSPKKPKATDLDHPEHGQQGFPAGAVCAVVFQRNLDAEERVQRVRD
jgi:hypothetical protein